MQEQIEEQKEKKNDEDEEVDMKGFVKDIQNMKNRMNYATNHVHEQDKRFVNINEKLDDYNKNVKKGENYTDIVNKGVFGYLKDKFVGMFSFKKGDLSKKDKKTIEQAKNRQQIEDNKDKNNNGNNIKENEDIYLNGENKRENKKDDDDDVDLDEALNEVRQMRKAVREFSSAVKDSSELVDATNNNMDRSINNVNKLNKKMKKAI